MRYFEDLQLGEKFNTADYVMTAAEITAFMLKANKFPAGAADLSADAAALKAITIVK